MAKNQIVLSSVAFQTRQANKNTNSKNVNYESLTTGLQKQQTNQKENNEKNHERMEC